MSIEEMILSVSDQLKVDMEKLDKLLVNARYPLEETSRQIQETHNTIKNFLMNTMILNIDISDSISMMIENQKFYDDLHKFENEYEIFSFNFIGIMSAKEILGIYRRWKEGDNVFVRDYFNKKFEDKENVDNLMEKIFANNLFSERKEILKDAADAHYNRKYTLSIPVIFAQVDGIFNDAYGHILKGEKEIKCEKCNRIINNINPWARNITKKLLDDDHIKHEFSIKFLECMYKKYDKDRNAILHGGRKDYASQELSTLLIISLYELFVTLEMEKRVRRKMNI